MAREGGGRGGINKNRVGEKRRETNRREKATARRIPSSGKQGEWNGGEGRQERGRAANEVEGDKGGRNEAGARKFKTYHLADR